MDLIELKKSANAGNLPFTLSTAYKMHSQKTYPKLILKIGGKLFWDKEEWERMAEGVRDQQVKEAKRIRAGINA